MRKEALIEAGIRLMEENGYEKTSVAKIVQKAGVAQGTFYLYFSTKQELIIEISKKILQEQFALAKERVAAQNSQDIGTFLESLTQTIYEISEKRKRLIRVIYTSTMLMGSFDQFEKVYHPYYEWIGRQLEESSVPMESIQLARLVVGTLEQAATVHVFAFHPVETLETSKRNVLLFLKQACGVR